jgi:hypothetical protein
MHGQCWKSISRIVGRTDMDCRDRYRNHLKYWKIQLRGESKHMAITITDAVQAPTGPWSTAEEQDLARIVQEICNKGGGSREGIPWSEVSKRMAHTHGRQQCSAKW